MELARRLQEQYDREAAMQYSRQRQPRNRGRSAEITIPAGAQPGQALVFMDGGMRRTVFVPSGARPGDRVSFPLPDMSRGDRTSTTGSGGITRTVVDLNRGNSSNNRGLRRRDAGHYQGGLSEAEAIQKAIEESKRAAKAASERRRSSLQEEEKGGMAPAIVKRNGYRRSVYMTDQTPCAKCEGELMKKAGLSTKRVFCRLNNSYLNYYTGTKQNVISESRMSSPDGSYNLQRIFSLKVDSQNNIVMSFHGGITKTLNAMSPSNAKRWYKCIEERRLWFRDITTAAESRQKLKQAQERQQFEIEKQVEDLTPVGLAVGEKKEPDSEEESESESEQEDLDLMENTAPVVGEIPVGGNDFEKRNGGRGSLGSQGQGITRRLSQFDPFAEDGEPEKLDTSTTVPVPVPTSSSSSRRLSQFDPFAQEEEAPPKVAPPPSYNSTMNKKPDDTFDPFASSTGGVPVRQSSFDPFADIEPVKPAATTTDPFASIPIASTNSAGFLSSPIVRSASQRSAERQIKEATAITDDDPFADLF